MSIEKVGWTRDVGNMFEVVCDDCGEVEEIEGDFEDCIEFINENGWQSIKEGEEWNNYCPDCKIKKE